MTGRSHFLNYRPTNLKARVIFRHSDMILTIVRDVVYLNVPKSQNRASSYHYLGTQDEKLSNGPLCNWGIISFDSENHEF